jgi:AcrR family transcriptional regulator
MLVHPSPPGAARERILDAAEKLVVRDGAGHLTLDAVAQTAGVSKGGLLYHFRTKDALLAGMIDRHVGLLEARCAVERAGLPPTCESSEIKAWIVGVLEAQPEREEVGAALFAAAANNPALLDGVRRRYAEHVQRLEALGDSFGRAAVILLAVDGLMLGEAWRITPFTPGQRARIVAELLRLADEACAPRIPSEEPRS